MNTIFFAGEYICGEEIKKISIEITIGELSDEDIAIFRNEIEFYDQKNNTIITYEEGNQLDTKMSIIRVGFKGFYSIDEDDFTGYTYFVRSWEDDDHYTRFTKKQKYQCGFLYLRTIRTGNRALSLEHGSLLDIILRINEIRPKMWEEVIKELSSIKIAESEELGIAEILLELQNSIKNLVPTKMNDAPSILVSNMTREHLRKILTVFMDSGVKKHDETTYYTPFYNLGSGSTNALVLSLLNILAKEKKNVIFAMEEPEISLPPYAQKRIVKSIIDQSAQSIFTSHSPYVLEEFEPKYILHINRTDGIIDAKPLQLFPNVKKKAYQDEVRRRFCEALVSNRVLIVEGRTELEVFQAASRKIQLNNPNKIFSLDAQGLAIVNAEGQTKIPQLCKYFRELGKDVIVICDKQAEEDYKNIEKYANIVFESKDYGIECSILDHLDSYQQLQNFALEKEKEGLISNFCDDPVKNLKKDKLKEVMFNYFKKNKTGFELASFVCTLDCKDMPPFVRDTIISISEYYCQHLQIALEED